MFRTIFEEEQVLHCKLAATLEDLFETTARVKLLRHQIECVRQQRVPPVPPYFTRQPRTRSPSPPSVTYTTCYEDVIRQTPPPPPPTPPHTIHQDTAAEEIHPPQDARRRRMSPAPPKHMQKKRQTKKQAEVAQQRKIPAVPAETKHAPITTSSRRNPDIAPPHPRYWYHMVMDPKTGKLKRKCTRAERKPTNRFKEGDQVREQCDSLARYIGTVTRVTASRIQFRDNKTKEVLSRKYSNVVFISRPAEVPESDTSSNDSSLSTK